ncbi:50S ribosomal protein L9 [Candidatus Wolfebacteria bacterium]|nr:MAG: 50S ribosomal protein L9 [Candidatus Wolfebacteria bacterium]
MKVILLKHVSKVGQQHEIKEVSDGYALNFLVPRGLATPATGSALKDLEYRKEQKGAKNATSAAENTSQIELVNGKTFVIKEKANDKGHLFRGIHAKEIVASLKEQDVVLTEKIISLSDPIKETGKTEITVSAGEVKGSFTLDIQSA